MSPGEKSVPESYAALRTKLSQQELLVYSSVLSLSSMQDLSVGKRKTKFMSDLRTIMPVSSSEWSYSRLDQWLEKNMGESADNPQTRWLEPRNDAGANPIQKIAYKIEKIREPQIVKAVEGLLKSKDNVVIAYGKSHFVKQAPVYERAFGPPKIECLSGPPARNSGPPSPGVEAEAEAAR